MKYRIRHRTMYRYDAPAAVSHNVLFLTPRSTTQQILIRHRILLQPSPELRVRRTDTFGNTYEIITVESPHRQLKIAADSTVEVTSPLPTDPVATPAFEETAALLRRPKDEGCLAAAELAYPSPLVPRLTAAEKYARESFPPGRPVLAGAMDLMGRIYREFRYDPRATTVSTPIEKVLEMKAGVCQDFAHWMIASLRAMGLAARYVSGYLETLPPPGRPRLVGADASHAWVSVFVPGFGWVDLDPTNNLLPGERHVTVAWGRDYRDVTPVRGVVLGGGANTLEVSVDVAPEVGA